MEKIILATRKSPLALAQARMVASRLHEKLGVGTELLPLVTTGDRQAEWSLEKRGGKGLFTGELEQALLDGKADAAVHSAKDLPGDMADGLAIAGYLPREDPRDVLVLREGVAGPTKIATGSPRRRLQISLLFPAAAFTEIRGNVDTRLRKIAAGEGGADATLLAAAGLARLGIREWPGVTFRVLDCEQMVPAPGQAAIAVQCRAADAARFAAALDAETARRVALERAFQTALGGGCHTAAAAHATDGALWFFHEKTGPRRLPLEPGDFKHPAATARRVLRHLDLQPNPHSRGLLKKGEFEQKVTKETKKRQNKEGFN
ncbi:MAG: hydroxymethylbilane synthase [Opitutaceae bacterium]|jgi:hydroxymethylbilane synthase|nr:hydroxymethylbilane synthase [Opitutaceae bacterium]